MKRDDSLHYTREWVDRSRRNFSTPNGVVFDEEYYSNGAGFTLIDEGQGDAELKKAESFLRANRDVVGTILVAKVES